MIEVNTPYVLAVTKDANKIDLIERDTCALTPNLNKAVVYACFVNLPVICTRIS